MGFETQHSRLQICDTDKGWCMATDNANGNVMWLQPQIAHARLEWWPWLSNAQYKKPSSNIYSVADCVCKEYYISIIHLVIYSVIHQKREILTRLCLHAIVPTCLQLRSCVEIQHQRKALTLGVDKSSHLWTRANFFLANRSLRAVVEACSWYSRLELQVIAHVL